MKTYRFLLIIGLALAGSIGLVAASGILELPQTGKYFGIGAAFLLLGWFVLGVSGYWALRFKALLNGAVMAVALSFAAFQGIWYLAETYLVRVDFVDRWAALTMSAIASLVLTKLIAPTPVRRAVVGGPQENGASQTEEAAEPERQNFWRFKSKQTFWGVQVGLWAYALLWLGLHWVVWGWLDIELTLRALSELALVMFMPNWPLLIRGQDWQTRKLEQGKEQRLRPVL